ncbi:MAG TPA: SufD family Fe-S cluster assembly protein, partial [Caulobacteraceae bacterium]
MSLARAIVTGDLAQLPSRRDEDWRWSDIRALVRVLPEASPAFAGDLPPAPFGEVETIAIVNGRGPARIEVAVGERRVLALRYVATDAGAHASKIEIHIAESAALVLLESHEGHAGYVTQADLAVTLAVGARLERIVLATDGEDAVAVARADIELAPGASLAQTVLTTGAKRQRLETRVAHPGGGASARLDALYLLSGRRHADLTTVVVHDGLDGTTDQLTKGVVTDQARGVFQGRIEVRSGADRTDARMGHHAL